MKGVGKGGKKFPVISTGIWNEGNVSKRLGVFTSCSRKGTFAFFCAVPAGVCGRCGWWGHLRKTGPPSTVSQDRGSLAQSLTGSWGAAWPHCFWAGSELGIPGKGEVKFTRLDLINEVTSHETDSSMRQFKVPKSQNPAERHLCFRWYRGSLKRSTSNRLK